MYALHVFYPDEPSANHIEVVTTAALALSRIPMILKEHHGCERIVVFYGAARLFAVDCKGNTLPG